MTEIARYRLTCPSQWTDIFIAEFGDLGFDMMQETNSGLEAFIQASRMEEIKIEPILNRYKHIEGLSGSWKLIQSKNWNSEWEKNYDPVIIDNRCLIRAPFHVKNVQFEYEVIIDPKMSFGTGHHPTTSLMISTMMNLDLKDRIILDAGTGTGVLSILAEIMGAAKVDAYDIDEWCTTNCNENLKLNSCSKVSVQKGTIDEVNLAPTYNYIFANINKNILLSELGKYVNQLGKDGCLFLSGFYSADCKDLIEESTQLNLDVIFQREDNDWAILGLKSKA